MDIVKHLCTFFAFISALFLVPWTVGLYFVVNGTRKFWHGLLTRRFPSLEFIRNVTVRTATDTMRNQGIITILLTVKGRYDIDLIKEKLKENMERRNKDGKLLFPHLQTALTYRWGTYAWDKKTSSFDIGNHVLEGTCMYRGRAVTDLNIQEYASDIVAKYLPSEISPWQITIIPSYSTERFYMLIRIHHLLLSEEGVGLGDLLLLGPERQVLFRRLLDEDDENPQDVSPASSPLTGLMQTPTAIPKLYYSIVNDATVHWNQFLSTYDPLENPELMKNEPRIDMCLAIILITAVSILKEMWVLFKKSDVSIFTKVVRLCSIFANETGRRQCTARFLITGIFNSLKPINFVSSAVKWFIIICHSCAITIPLVVVFEIRAILSRNKNKGFSKSLTESTFYYVHLLAIAAKELLYILSIIYTAPKMLLNELLISHRGPKHEFQTISLCGRKVVAWSEPVPLDRIRRIGNNLGASPSEILISATSGALKEYFRKFGLPVPETVLATARYFPLESLMKISRGVDDSTGPPSGRGLLCLALPTSQLQEDPRETLQEVQKILGEARERQTAIYEASLWQLDGGYITRIFPSLAVRLILNHLSRRYAIALTEVAPEVPDESRKQLIWGQEVEAAMYWRPPQSNICLSLTLMCYGDSVRFGVMADSMIAPGHIDLTIAFLQQINMLAALAGIQTDRNSLSIASSSLHSYQPNIPPESSNTSVSSASEELRRLATGSPDLNITSSSGTSRSNSPESGAQSARSSNDENIFPFTD